MLDVPADPLMAQYGGRVVAMADRDEDDDGQETRTERRRRETHETLLDSTLQLVVERGVNGFSVTDVVNLADVAGGTFYNHFADRDEAIRELVRRAVSENSVSIDDVSDDEPVGRVLATFLVNGLRSMRDLEFARLADSVIHSHIWPLDDTPPPALVILRAAERDGAVPETARVELCYRLLAGLANGHARAVLAGVDTELRDLAGAVALITASMLDLDADELTATAVDLADRLVAVGVDGG